MLRILLSPVLDLAAAPALKQDLLEAFAGTGLVAIDAAQVARIGSPCLQLLVAAVIKGASLTNSSAAFGETASLLGLTAALKLENADV